MDIAIGLVVLFVLWLIFNGKRKKGGVAPASPARSNPEIDRKRRILNANLPWLQQRWEMARAEQASGTPVHFPKWYFDDPTPRQLDRLVRDGLSVSGGPTKGQASDIIGIFEPPDDDDGVAKLKFFGRLPNGEQLNQTRVRHELALLGNEPAKEEAWRNRPATPLQREFYRFVGEKPPTNVTFAQAEAKLEEALRTLPPTKLDEWSQFTHVVEEFEDRETREDMGIKKPTLADIREAMTEMRAKGGDIDPTSPFDVADYLLEKKPALARS